MWFLPTLDRIDKLKHCLKTMIQAEVSTPGLVLVDEIDHGLNHEAYDEIEQKHLPNDWKIHITKGVTMGDKCRDAWPMVTALPWVGILNDDFNFVTKGWDKILISKLDGTTFSSANDRWNAPIKATTATAWSMPLLKALDWPIYPPGLQHLFIDDVWEALGKHTGCWRICMNSVVEHFHVLKGYPKDKTHEKVYNSKFYETDKATFELFMKHDFRAAIDKIKSLQDQPACQTYNPLIKKEAP